MMRRYAGALLFALAMLAGNAARAEDLVSREIAAVVSISVLRAGPAPKPDGGSGNAVAAPASPRGTRVIGSGFIIDPGGLIVTNQHVVDRAKDILVMLHDGTLLRATLVNASALADVAVIRVTPEAPLPAVRFGDSDRVKVADPVLAVGNPLGLGGSVTRGIVSALDRDIRETPYDDFIQTDAAINHGNSGGPLYNEQGEVIGMNTVIFSPEPTSGSIGLGFAVPSNDVRFVAEALQRPGGMRSGTLDFVVQQVTPEIADALGLRKAEGVIVGGTKEGGAASRCGIMAGDIVLRFGSMPVSNVRALARAIARTPPGTAIPLLLWRNEEPVMVTATVQALPPDAEEAAPVAAAPADPGWALAPAADGVAVTRVDPAGPAQEAGLAAGDVILRIQQERVGSAQDAARVIAAARAQQRRYVIALVHNGEGLRWFGISLE